MANGRGREEAAEATASADMAATASLNYDYILQSGYGIRWRLTSERAPLIALPPRETRLLSDCLCAR